MCQYTFPLCDNDTLILPTQEQCMQLSDQCSLEWNLTRRLGYQDLLPNCTKLLKTPSAGTIAAMCIYQILQFFRYGNYDLP